MIILPESETKYPDHYLCRNCGRASVLITSTMQHRHCPLCGKIITRTINEAETMPDCPICEGKGSVVIATFLTCGGVTKKTRRKRSCPECGGSGKISRDRGYRSSLD